MLAANVATSRPFESASSGYGAIKILRCTKVLQKECVLLASTPQGRMSCSRSVHEARDGDFFWSEAINAK